MNSSVSDFFHILAVALEVAKSGVRVALLFLIAAPAFFIIIAALGGQWLVGWLALVALFAGLVVLTDHSGILAAAGTIDMGRKVFRVLLVVVVFDLVLALYLALVPVYSNPKLIPIVVLSGVVVVLTASSDHSGMGCLRGILICCIIVVTLAFFLSSKDVSDFVKQMNDQSKRNAASGQATPSYPNCSTNFIDLTPNNPTAQFPLHMGCWSDNVHFSWPYGTPFNFNFNYSGKFMYIRLADGRTFTAGDDGNGKQEFTWEGKDYQNVRLRGPEGSTLTVTSAKRF